MGEDQRHSANAPPSGGDLTHVTSGMTSRLSDVQQFYASASDDPPFSLLLTESIVEDDSSLADLIETDGRWRQQRGIAVTLERYLGDVPDLAIRPVALDAAIDVALRWLSGGSDITTEAVANLVQMHPEFSSEIHEAAALAKAVWSTRGLQARVTTGPARDLPCDFGPAMTNGQSRYQLQKLLGHGAFGQVYLALDRQLSEGGHTALVAIKVANAGHRSPWLRQKAIEEAAKVRRVNHRHVVTVHDRGVTDQDEDFTVYEYVDGGDLNTLLEDRGKLPPREAAAMMSRIARGVHAAHSAGVIHCDLKPGNIMLTSAGDPKVVDFGIAVQQDQGHLLRVPDEMGMPGPIGNVAFISPEQYRGEDGALSVPSDVYALGGILYYMITGTLPNGTTIEDIRRAHAPIAEGGRSGPPLLRTTLPTVDRDLELICQRAMAVRPDDRYHSAAALADDLDRWGEYETIPWTRPGLRRSLRLWAKRKPALAACAAVITLLLIGGSIAGVRLTKLAQDRKIEAAIAQVKLEEREQRQANAANTAKKMSDSVRVLGDDFRLKTEALLKIWVFEHMVGPEILGMPDEQRSLWKSRVAVFRSLVTDARQAGRDGELEPMLQSSLLAFFLVCDGDHEEAIPLLDANIARWSGVLADRDPWLDDLRSIRLAAEINRLNVSPKNSQAALSELEEQLQQAIDRQAADRAGTPLHFLLLKSQVTLYGSTLLNQPERAASLQKALEVLIDNKPPAKAATQPST